MAPQLSFARALIDGLTGWLRGRPTTSESAPAASVPAGAAPDAPPDTPFVREVAQRIRQDELASGGWAAEAGGVPSDAYVPEAQRLARKIALGELQSGPPTP